jgi:hypothetical protein
LSAFVSSATSKSPLTAPLFRATSALEKAPIVVLLKTLAAPFVRDLHARQVQGGLRVVAVRLGDDVRLARSRDADDETGDDRNHENGWACLHVGGRYAG